MKRFLLAALLTATFSANATPVLYEMKFDPTLGPAGTGSFSFDMTTGAMTDLKWIFNGLTGSFTVPDTAVLGGTYGQFFFEILTEIDVHPVDCSRGCSFNSPVTGGSPLGATRFGANSVETSLDHTAAYNFSNNNGTVASGFIDITAAQVAQEVPEPATVSLIGAGLLALGAGRKRYPRKQP